MTILLFLLAGLVSQEEGDVWGDTGSIDMGATGNVIAWIGNG